MRIDRCVCHGVPFEEVKRHCDAHPGCTFRDVTTALGCTQSCAMCEPYIRRTMRTGQVVFHQVITARDEPAIRG